MAMIWQESSEFYHFIVRFSSFSSRPHPLAFCALQDLHLISLSIRPPPCLVFRRWPNAAIWSIIDLAAWTETLGLLFSSQNTTKLESPIPCGKIRMEMSHRYLLLQLSNDFWLEEIIPWWWSWRCVWYGANNHRQDNWRRRREEGIWGITKMEMWRMNVGWRLPDKIALLDQNAPFAQHYI